MLLFKFCQQKKKFFFCFSDFFLSKLTSPAVVLVVSELAGNATNATATGAKWTDGGVFTVLGLNSLVFVLLVLLFSALRLRFPQVYTPRIGPVASGLLSWARETVSLDSAAVMEASGLEGLMYLGLLRALFSVSVVAALLSSGILAPFDNTGRANWESAVSLGTQAAYVRGFPNWTVANLFDRSPFLWLHAAAFALLSAQCVWVLLSYQRSFHEFRQQAARVNARSADQRALRRSILISNLPRELEDPLVVARFLEEQVLGSSGCVQHVELVQDLADMAKLCAKRDALLAEIKRCERMEEAGHPVTKKVGGLIPPLMGDKVPALPVLRAELEKCNSDLARERAKGRYPMTGVAFVTFRDPVQARRVVQNFFFKRDDTVLPGVCAPPLPASSGGFFDLLFAPTFAPTSAASAKSPLLPQHHDNYYQGSANSSSSSSSLAPLPGTRWLVEGAPLPKDVQWGNLHVSSRQGLLRSVLVLVATFWLVLFWSIPVSFLGSLRNLATVPFVGRAFKPLLNLPPGAVDFLSAYLPTIVLILFNMMLPAILFLFGNLVGLRTRSALEAFVMRRFFTFTLFSTVILPAVFIGGLAQLKALTQNFAKNPFGELLSLLTIITAPKSGFFVAYITQAALMGTGMAVARLVPLVAGKIKAKLAVTDADRKAAFEVEPFDFWLHYASSLLVFAITMLFAITMPITPAFGAMYFGAKYVFDKYLLVFVHPRPTPTDGSMIASGIRISWLILVLMQIATAGMFAGKRAIGPMAVAVAFLGIGIGFFVWSGKELELIFRQDLWIPERGGGAGAQPSSRSGGRVNDDGLVSDSVNSTNRDEDEDNDNNAPSTAPGRTDLSIIPPVVATQAAAATTTTTTQGATTASFRNPSWKG